PDAHRAGVQDPARGRALRRAPVPEVRRHRHLVPGGREPGPGDRRVAQGRASVPLARQGGEGDMNDRDVLRRILRLLTEPMGLTMSGGAPPPLVRELVAMLQGHLTTKKPRKVPEDLPGDASRREEEL